MLCTLKHRAEFLRIRGGARHGTPSLLIEGKRRVRADGDGDIAADVGSSLGAQPRFGFTVTKKQGCAVVRNRIRRRLREVVSQLLRDGAGQPGCDYVIVARDAALRRTPADLRRDLQTALKEVDRRLAASRR